ncbi:MAG: PQQ-binding-like beta-propeller repeat protein [Verrucomicrobiaceae bacterium]|nr:PQQ-binding-like beta-propeller repeat protein [Verrucomicrobiaceae bacterium]
MKWFNMNANCRFKVLGRSGRYIPILAAVVAVQQAGGDIKNVAVPAPEIGKASRNLVEGASLKTDAEADDLLARAEHFAGQGRYDLAGKLWQTVIDSSNDLMFTKDEWIEKTLEHEYQRYRSVSRDIEATIANLPGEGREGYRLKADAEAKLIMDRPRNNDGESALAEVVRRYFISSLGDDAAFDLACLKLDRYEFLPAIRLLDKIINDYPSPSVDKDLVLLRLAVLNARVGDTDRAEKIVKDLRSRATPSVSDRLLALVEVDIKKSGRPSNSVERSGKSWPMFMGGANRSGVMAFPEMLPDKDAVPVWVQPYELNLPEAWPELPSDGGKSITLNVDDPFGRGLGRGSTTSRKPSTPKEMKGSWLKHGWVPSARLLFHDGNIYFKTHNRLVCADAHSGELRWLGFRNNYPARPTPYSNRSSSEQVGRAPIDVNEIHNFADSVNQSMCVVADKVLTIQGIPVDFTEERSVAAKLPVDPMARRRIMMNRGVGGLSRMRENRLVAYHARNGKLQWMRGASEPDADIVKKSCFTGPPVPYAGLVLVPVMEGNGMYLVALEAEGGATQWRTFLGDDPSSGSAQNGTVVISVDGGEAYVATGAGLLFSVDAISGSMNWAVSYPRTTEKDPARDRQLQRFGVWGGRAMGGAKFDGWQEEMIIPSANSVIVTPTDFNHLIAFDRRSGRLVWESARGPGGNDTQGEYALGVNRGRVYVAGKGVVRCYKAAGGRLLWESVFQAGYGRGALTEKGLFVPTGKNKIVRLSLDSGKEMASIAVKAMDEQPLGNLYSDGNRLYGAGLRKVYAIGEVVPGGIEEDPVTKETSLGEISGEANELIAQTFLRITEAYQRGVSHVDFERRMADSRADFSGIVEGFKSLAKQLESIPLPSPSLRSEILTERILWNSGQQARLERAKLMFSRVPGDLDKNASRKAAVLRAIEDFKTELIPMREVYSKYGIEIP